VGWLVQSATQGGRRRETAGREKTELKAGKLPAAIILIL
jgi:hypothetical protein